MPTKELLNRFQQMEELNRKLLERLERSELNHRQQKDEHDRQIRSLMDKIEKLSSRVSPNPAKSDAARTPTAPLGRDDSVAPAQFPPLPEPGLEADAVGPPPEPTMPMGGTVAGEDEPIAPEYNGPVPEYETQPIEPNPFRSRAPRPSTISSPSKIPLDSNFGPGFQYMTRDEEFLLQIHIQSQVEARIWNDTNHTPFQDGFFLPRQRIFFNGRMTRPIEYVFSLNRGFGELNILETFLNFHPIDQFQVRFGRYFTPLGYDQFAVRNLWLPTPERSLFTTNLGPNRQVGLMAWGYLLDKRLDYAAGIFTGPRNSFEDTNSAKDFMGYVNARPFQNSRSLSFLRDLNVGTSVDYGRQDQVAVPQSFRIGAVAPTNSSQDALASAPFLTLNQNTLEQGPRLLGSVHSAYYYKGLSLISEWNYGYGTYASPARHSAARIPISAFYVTGAYFLTGEHVDRRAMIMPRRPVVPTRPGQRPGIGAWELVGRVSQLTLGNEVFDTGLADRNRWSNSATTTELGLNWYWNEYLKIYMFWLHGNFGDPVYYQPGRPQTALDMFWLRFQLYF
ncbi:MAG: hypothetical protein ABS79_07780 [Planctomycetes bacterium SCN 63-9]|nr:MAG: hypothetical protein ABS79_07780 [Planctomycetes bacterium SCN 63-9]